MQGYVVSASQKVDEANTILTAIRNEYGYPFTAATAAGRPNGDYYPTRKSGANYTQQEMHDAIVACCHLYGVIPVDVYQDGIMDTKHAQYRTTADNYTAAEPTDYCDKDGVHPLAYGYQQVYVPLIKTKLSNATRKDDAEDE